MSKNIENNLEFIIETKDLLHALGFATSVVEKRNVMIELGNIKLVAKNGILKIGATDMDLYLNQHVGAEVISEEETTVSTQTISDIVRKIPDSRIKLKQVGGSNKLKIIGSNYYFELLTLPAIQFPLMEDVESASSLTLSCEDFARVIEYTNFAMSTEETRYNLNGIYMHVIDKEFSGVATDGHRLSVASIVLNKKSDEFGVIVPRKTISELLKIVKDSKNIQSEIEIFLSINKIKFKCNNLVLISKLIDGTFPKYSSFIPTENQSKLTVNTKKFAAAIDRVATVTVDKFRAVKMFISSNAIKITASGEAKGFASEQLVFSEQRDNHCMFSGPDLAIGFNPKYIGDVLSALNEEQVEVYFKDAFSPALIKTTKNPKDCFVVMPVRV